MTVVRGWVAGTEFEQTPNIQNRAVWELLAEGIAINSKAHIRKAPHGSSYEYLGNKTECGLLLLATKMRCDWLDARRRNPVIKQLPFDSDRKRMSTVVESRDGSGYRVYVKGAAEIILERCSRIVTDSASVARLDDDTRNDITGLLESFSSEALRTIVMAYRDLPEDYDPNASIDNQDEEDLLENDLTFIAVVGIEDPLRPDVKNAVRTCQEAGITVRMVTGDCILFIAFILQDFGFTLSSLGF